LIEATRYGHEAMMRLLLEKGADVNLKDKRGFTALWWAKRRRQEELVRLLQEHGASWDHTFEELDVRLGELE
jgi:ankyrin repeat protein